MAKSSKDKQKVDELTADLKRVQADFVNFKQRADEERLRYTRFGRGSAVMALLPLIDNIERALGHTPKELKDHEWANGVKSVAKQAADVLKGLGVAKIESTGQEFNPDLHEAVHMDESQGKKEIVTDELQPGYTMDGEVIRHAMVKVGRK